MKKSASSAKPGNVTRLLKEKRLEDLQRTTEDEKYREKLLKEYGIK